MYVRRILRQTSSAMENPAGDLLSPVPPRTVAVVGLPRPDGKSLAGTRCMSASDHPIAIDSSSLNEHDRVSAGCPWIIRAYTRSGDSLTSCGRPRPSDSKPSRSFLLFDQLSEMLREQRDVVAPFRQRRKRNRKNV